MSVTLSMTTLAQVALGGALGASARYLTGIGMRSLMGPGFPWGTLTVNIVGSVLMGVLVVVLEKSGGIRLAPFLMIGLLGGFTTFSSFSLDVAVIYERGDYLIAGFYIFGSVILSILGLFAGMAATRWVLG